MNDIIEIVVTSDASGQCSSTVWDPRTGTCLQNFKGGNILSPKTLQFIGNDYLIAAERLKPLLHVWPVNSQEPIQELRIVCAGTVQALSVSPNGLYCAAGIAEKLYVWLVCSGKLLAIASKHYQSITCIKFTDDGNFIITAGEDGIIMVWKLSYLIQKNCSSDPLYTFSEHSLSITDFYVTPGGARSHVVSASLDRTFKIFDLRTGELLYTTVFNKPLSSVVMDSLERKVYVGTALGEIYECTINNELKVDDSKSAGVFIGHSDMVNCLSINHDGDILLSGSKDATVRLWHIGSKMNLRTINLQKCVTNAFFAIPRKNMFKQDCTTEVIIKKFQKNLEEKDTSNLCMEVVTYNTDDESVNLNDVIQRNTTSEKHSERAMKRANLELFKTITTQVLSNNTNSINMMIPEEYQSIIKNMI